MKFRDILWDYPDIMGRVTRGLAPFSYILLTISVLFLIGSYILEARDYTSILSRRNANSVSEGTVGYLSNLNPLYIPQSQVDRDIQALVFRKIVKIDGKGQPHPDLAKSWKVSSDLLKYEFTLDGSAKWHSGDDVTADDVIFTFNTARDLSTKLSQETIGQGFEGLSIEKIDRYRFRVVLDQYSATFWESISIYVVPAFAFEGRQLSQISESTFSRKPIGSGYFEVVNSNEALVTLKRTPHYNVEGDVQEYNYYIFKSVDELEVAFRNNRLDIVSGVGLRDLDYVSEYSKTYDVLQTVINTRKKVLFLNNRVSSFGTSSVRRGLNYILNREEVVKLAKVDGVVTYSSFSSKSWAYVKNLPYYLYDQKKADAEFQAGGYKKDESSGYYQSSDGKVLTVTITYLDNDANSAIVTVIKDLLDKEGIIVELEGLSFDRLTKETLATRDYDILMYEIESSIDPDQYDLWHSLRKDYPYLNLSGYTYDRVDIFLERGRTQVKQSDRLESYTIVQRLINDDAPAIFLYEPQFNVVVSNRIENLSLTNINYPEERYNTVLEWEL